MATNKFEKTPEGVTQYLVGHDENGFMKKELTSSFARTDKIIKGDGINITFDPATNVVTVALDPDVATTIENSKVVDTLKDLAFKDKVALVDIDALGDRNSNTFLSGDGTFRTPAGAGDMVASVYDPDGIAADAFSLGNMKETADAKKFTSVEKDKLDGIEVGATKNQTDAHLLDRQNHTGTQLLETISDAGELAALDNITMSRVTDAGSLATKNNITLSEVTDAGLLAGKDNIVMSEVTDAGELAILDSITANRISNSGILSGFRNQVINGNFDIWERGIAFTIPAGGSLFTADRWLVANSTDQSVSVVRVPFGVGNYNTVPGSPRYGLALIFNTAPTIGTVNVIQRIEGVRTLEGKECSARTYINRSGGGTSPESYSVDITQMFGTGGSPSSNVIVEPSFTDKSIIFDQESRERNSKFVLPSLEGKTIGSNGGDNIQLRYKLEARQAATYVIARTSLVEGDFVDDPDPFSGRSIGEEIILCRRYFRRYTSAGIWRKGILAPGDNTIGFPYSLDIPMRVPPACTVSGPVSIFDGTQWIDKTATATSLSQGNNDVIQFRFTPGITGNPGILWKMRSVADVDCIVNLDAEII